MILVTGAGGLVGAALVRTGEVTGQSRSDLDITDEDAIASLLDATRPDAVINAAAQAGVDRSDSEPDWTMAVNGTAPGVIARLCADRGIRCVHLSSDYVLDAPDVDRLTEDLPTQPGSTYARSKLAGEEAALETDAVVIRLQWVYHPGHRGFFTHALQTMARGEEMGLVTDQIGCPTPAAFVAPALLAAARGGPTGLFHLACDGEASAWDWIAKGAEVTGVPLRARPVQWADLGGAHRPTRSCLDSTRFAQAWSWTIPHWADALAAVCSVWDPARP